MIILDLNALISTPERRAQFKQLCDRGLNTWDGAPQWLLELCDQLGEAKPVSAQVPMTQYSGISAGATT